MPSVIFIATAYIYGNAVPEHLKEPLSKHGATLKGVGPWDNPRQSSATTWSWSFEVIGENYQQAHEAAMQIVGRMNKAYPPPPKRPAPVPREALSLEICDINLVPVAPHHPDTEGEDS